MSIIIVGIGNENFTNMNILDADEEPLVSSWGEKMSRDIVQFVPFKDFQNDAFRLRQEILHEIPDQVVSYFAMQNIQPVQRPNINVNDFNYDRGNTMRSIPEMKE